MEKTIILSNGKEIPMKASALIPRIYRSKFNRDLIVDMQKLSNSYNEVLKSQLTDDEKNQKQFEALDLTIFENVAWCLAKNADKSIEDSPEEWLDNMEGMFSIIEILPSIMELWGISVKTTATPRKK